MRRDVFTSTLFGHRIDQLTGRFNMECVGHGNVRRRHRSSLTTTSFE